MAIRRFFRRLWRYSYKNIPNLVLIFAPIITSPLLILSNTKEARCGWVILVMGLYWMFEVIPMAMTSLMPVFLFPLLGILDSKVVTQMYMKETAMMFIGGLMLALAVEHCNLHKRIALKTLLTLGTSDKWLILGFMLPTGFLSMCMSNTSTTAMMLPIIKAILDELQKGKGAILAEEEGNKESSIEAEMGTGAETDMGAEMGTEAEKGMGKEMGTGAEVGPRTETGTGNTRQLDLSKLRELMMLAVAYSANIGGAATLTGTGTNLVFSGMIQEIGGSEINYASWMMFAFPMCFLCILMSWGWLQIYFLGFRHFFSFQKKEANNKAIKTILRQQYERLGRINSHEVAVSTLFTITVLLWIFRRPGFIPGWASLFPETNIGDTVPVFLILFFMFALPANPLEPLLGWRNVNNPGNTPFKRIHSWSVVHSGVPWAAYFLIGSGFAIAEGVKASGLNVWIGDQLASFKNLSPSLIVFITSSLLAFITEFTSNVATANISLPVLANVAVAIHVNPLYLLVPATLSCSFAFMLPVATPPNTLVYAESGMKITEMMKAGLVMNILCIAALNLCLNTYGIPLFHLDKYPAWAANITAVQGSH